MTRCLAWIAALLLGGCATLATIEGLSLVGGYRMLDMPTAEVVVGATYKDGSPAGAGAATDNIVIERGFSALQFSRTTQRDLKLGFIRLLDLNPISRALSRSRLPTSRYTASAIPGCSALPAVASSSRVR